MTEKNSILCPNCRKTNVVDLYRRMAPWIKKQGALGQSKK